MEVEKKRSKGGFLNLFDWNGKSRKKLFTSNSESSAGLKQGKENVESFSKSPHYRVEVDENGTSSSNKGGDWNCASSVISDEGCGVRAPGVVARLMGLESLPASTVPEPSSTLLFDSHSHRAPHDDRSNSNSWSDFHALEYINMPDKMDKFSWNHVESRTQTGQNRPMARFQTEVLPPKSAKSIPITHHKLLSPIKSPAFIPTKNVNYIMEAASRIIEASPRTSAKSKVSTIGPSSIHLKIRDLKEKMEAVHKASRPERPKEVSDFKYVKGISGDRCHNGSDNVPLPKASVGAEKQGYKDRRNKGKSVSLAVQAKVNIQRREGSTSCSNRNFMNQKEEHEVKQNQVSKSRPSAPRPVHKRASADSTKSVLKQNNQKQNCVSNKDKMTPKSMAPNQPTRRMRSTNVSSRVSKTINKVPVNSEAGSGKLGSMEFVTGKEFSLSTMKNVSGKIRSVRNDVQLDDSISDNAFMTEDERSVKCNVAMDGCTNLRTDNRKQGMDIVSFTFTSPLKRSISELQSSSPVMSINNFYIDSFGNYDQQCYPANFTISSPGLNVIGGDALSVLLEQKLQELTCKVESSQRNLPSEGTAASFSSSLQDVVSSVASTTSRGKRLELDSIDDHDCLSIEVNQQWQGSEGMEDCGSRSKNIATGKEFDHQHFIPVSVFEPLFESRSGTDNRSSGNGCSLAQAQDQTNSLSSYETLPAYGVSEFLDSASSASTWDVSGKNMTRISSSEYHNPTNNWELEYVRYILSNVDLEMEDFALGDAYNVITPNLFDHLENQEEYPKLQQKLLFDCVNECLHSRCKHIFVGSRKAWDRLSTLSRRKGWLAEELHKEISGWKNMEELMGDELVDKDMSTGSGRWLNLDIEAFEESLDIEKDILSCLVDELVSDILYF